MEKIDKPYVVGVDIGGQTTKIGVVDTNGNIINHAVISSVYERDEAMLYIDSLCDTIRSLIDIKLVLGIGIGAPCTNYYTGVIENAVHLEWARYAPVNLERVIGERLGLPIKVTNDANAAAMGEMMYGAARGMKDYIVITLGSGVGSGIVINGSVVYGHDGIAGELGHNYAVYDGGRECGCGRKGCLDAYATIMGIGRTAQELLDSSDRDSILRNIDNGLTSKEVYDAAEEGDAIAIEAFEYTAKLLGECFALFAHFSSPEAFILFGGVARAHKYMLPTIERVMNEQLLPSLKGKIKVLISPLKDSDAAILGAAALAY